MKTLRSLIVITCIVALSGCAAIFANDSDKLNIRSKEPDAALFVNGNQVGTGQAVYPLARDKTAIITASKPGCSDMSVPTQQSIVGAFWLNIFFWPGFLIDAAAGTMHKADPTDYTVTPRCVAASYAPAQPGYYPPQTATAPQQPQQVYALQPVYPQPQPAATPAQPQPQTIIPR